MLKRTVINLTFLDVSSDPAAIKCLKDAPRFIAKLVEDKVMISAITEADVKPEPVSIARNVFQHSFSPVEKTDAGYVVVRKQQPMYALKVQSDFIVEGEIVQEGREGDYVVQSPDGTNTMVTQEDLGRRFTMLDQKIASPAQTPSGRTLH